MHADTTTEGSAPNAGAGAGMHQPIMFQQQRNTTFGKLRMLWMKEFSKEVFPRIPPPVKVFNRPATQPTAANNVAGGSGSSNGQAVGGSSSNNGQTMSSSGGLDDDISQLPTHVAPRFTRLAQVTDQSKAFASSIDDDYIMAAVANLMMRYKEGRPRSQLEQRAHQESLKEAEAATRAGREFLINEFHKTVEAAIVIQRAYRAYRLSRGSPTSRRGRRRARMFLQRLKAATQMHFSEGPRELDWGKKLSQPLTTPSGQGTAFDPNFGQCAQLVLDRAMQAVKRLEQRARDGIPRTPPALGNPEYQLHRRSQRVLLLGLSFVEREDEEKRQRQRQQEQDALRLKQEEEAKVQDQERQQRAEWQKMQCERRALDLLNLALPPPAFPLQSAAQPQPTQQEPAPLSLQPKEVQLDLRQGAITADIHRDQQGTLVLPQHHPLRTATEPAAGPASVRSPRRPTGAAGLCRKQVTSVAETGRRPYPVEKGTVAAAAEVEVAYVDRVSCGLGSTEVAGAGIMVGGVDDVEGEELEHSHQLQSNRLHSRVMRRSTFSHPAAPTSRKPRSSLPPQLLLPASDLSPGAPEAQQASKSGAGPRDKGFLPQAAHIAAPLQQSCPVTPSAGQAPASTPWRRRPRYISCSGAEKGLPSRLPLERFEAIGFRNRHSASGNALGGMAMAYVPGAARISPWTPTTPTAAVAAGPGAVASTAAAVAAGPGVGTVAGTAAVAVAAGPPAAGGLPKRSLLPHFRDKSASESGSCIHHPSGGAVREAGAGARAGAAGAGAVAWNTEAGFKALAGRTLFQGQQMVGAYRSSCSSISHGFQSRTRQLGCGLQHLARAGRQGGRTGEAGSQPCDMEDYDAIDAALSPGELSSPGASTGMLPTLVKPWSHRQTAWEGVPV